MAARAIQRGVRQSPRKMRLVIDVIRGMDVNDAYTFLRFSKKRAAKQIEKVLRSAVSNAEQDALRGNEAFDVDWLFVEYAVVNEGTTMWRYRAAALGRVSPIRKRTSHITVVVSSFEKSADTSTIRTAWAKLSSSDSSHSRKLRIACSGSPSMLCWVWNRARAATA